MPATTYSAAVYGLEARPVSVEVDVLGGLPSVTVVGLPDAAVQEARERIRSAIKNSGAVFPTTRVTINLSPADWRKEGPSFDLPIALALLASTSQLAYEPDDSLIIGELGLSGQVRPVNGILAVAELAKRQGRRLIVPVDNVAEASLLSGLKVVPIRSLKELLTTDALSSLPQIKGRHRIPTHQTSLVLWPSILGQQQAKRAMIIAAAGHHNALLIGPPGSGKTMLAQALRELLPPLTEEEALEVTKIHSVAGRLPQSGLLSERPFRQPHHTASVASLIGGGRIPKPGELSLAHRGVLFLDEFPEFSREHIEALRQPLEGGVISVNRVAGSVQFPAAGMVIAAMNPCPCGYAGDRQRPCRCSPASLERYRRRLSGPILDRFDIFISVPRVAMADVKSVVIDDPRAAIARTRKIQINRQAHQGMAHEKILASISVDDAADKILTEAIERLRLSMRSRNRILRVARTIADLADATTVTTTHVAEALQYRSTAVLPER